MKFQKYPEKILGGNRIILHGVSSSGSDIRKEASGGSIERDSLCGAWTSGIPAVILKHDWFLRHPHGLR
jgi:hypothetical protein